VNKPADVNSFKMNWNYCDLRQIETLLFVLCTPFRWFSNGFI